ncbi:hypothetical protein [Thiocapsa roseopersicina]|uniref:Uncharacterized protein n=1 Tax=Thiocapsa roseopersicina TaxID=1058 RepID=A0A1H2ZYH5_THIRO|nr:MULTISPECIES: hypothetical protein [Thiocapsa]CRI63848.1 hypothetical protein THIOKS1160014 [Thiocapsa sp. KS1]SDX21984.1 hypothetical protein SAMN05421783_11790 [Thiocapsa roseopersicina]
MVENRDEIRSTIRGIMGDSVPKPRPSEAAMPALSIDIGGINLKNENAFEHAHADRPIDPPLMAAAPSAVRLCHRQQLGVMRMLGIVLMFAAIAPLYVVQFLSVPHDDIILTVGFVVLILSLISFTIASMLEAS